ncbi:unnamed protein product (macronuclear) [Paramecium tetraurelia]|uniref:HTH psq-type domain-containing protein n=1 Tax=Paramecium tetraurelia TaxID=5888 RepID=A0DHQ5_PARTE|nr:uncharacterized protein GSPATT00016959001 [Paramecium tetraurelia]CAK82572.1 unnamed protein product [Paramecium tetraurelia]|eukprot:XP_001449969.1 hypothetical protein (macronuclear) [Paramecium tetraurelia strain d4-2]
MCKQDLPIKRVKERSIKEAKQKVDQWRSLYKNGEIDANGKKIKYSLNKAAEKVGVPKKSLEDYRYLLRKAQGLVDFNNVGDKRMGFLRLLLKQQEYIKKRMAPAHQKIFIDERSQMHEPQHQNNFVDMIVEGDTVKQIRDNEYLDYSYVLPHVQSTIEEHEGIHEKQMNITNTDYECQNGQLVLN